MAKDRFVEVYSQGVVPQCDWSSDVCSSDLLLGSHDLGAGAGLTVLVDQNGKPVITPIQ